ncbi:MAG: cytochrome D1 domain-containing protein, partial [Gammaproteobacteria bacterium]
MKLNGRGPAQEWPPATGRDYRVTVAALLVLMSASVVAQDGTLLVVNGDHQAGSVSFFDLATEVEVARVPIGVRTPHEVAVSPDGRWAVTGEYGPNAAPVGRRVVVIDVANARVAGYIDLGPNSRPHDSVFLPDSRRALVTMEAVDQLALVDVVALEVLRTYPIGAGAREGHMVQLSPDATRAYVAGRQGEGTVSVIYLLEDRAPTVIATGLGAEGLAVTGDGRAIWVLNQEEDSISVIDAQTLRVTANFPSADQPRRTAALPGGRVVIVNGNQAGASLRIYADETRAVLHDISISALLPGDDGYGFLLQGQLGFVSNRTGGRIIVYDLADPTAPPTILTDGHDRPDGMAWSPLRVSVLD